jgi:hypothetical protein
LFINKIVYFIYGILYENKKKNICSVSNDEAFGSVTCTAQTMKAYKRMQNRQILAQGAEAGPRVAGPIAIC